MLFSSYSFVLAFLPLALAGFFLAARMGQRAACLWLVTVSLLFYGWDQPGYVPLLIASIALNFGASRLISRTEHQPQRQALVLATAITGNLLALFVFKYLGPLLGALRASEAAGPAFNPVLPLGISFFTFTQIGFLIDCRGGLAHERGALNYALFVTFFPHLIAGPIVHHREIMPQLGNAETWRPNTRNVAAGLCIFLIGLLKKSLLADPLAALVRDGFAHPETLGLFGAWHTALGYSLQLYFDFSGYSDMAIGLARMFNLRFPANFASPYKAQSIIDYWQRWHMTMTRYLTLYLYNPLALWIARRRAASGLGNRSPRDAHGFAVTVAIPLFVTMGLAGIWHGAGLTFLAFGLLHGAYLTVNHAWRLVRQTRPRRGGAEPRPTIAASILVTYLCTLVGSVLFRAPTLGAAGHMLAAMLGLHGVTFQITNERAALAAARAVGHLATLFAIVWAAPNTQQIMRATEPVLGRIAPGPLPGLLWRPSLGWAVAFGCAGALALASLGGTGEFLYYRF